MRWAELNFRLRVGVATIDDADLAKLVESSLYDYEPDWSPPGLHLVDRPDLLMWSTSSPERGANRVARARWTEAEAEKGIDEVLAYFHDRNRAFTWCVGPSSMPADLDLRLEARGFVRDHVDLMLTAELPVQGLRTNRQVRIEHVRDEAGVISFQRLSREAHSDRSEQEFDAAITARLSYVRLPARRGGMLLAYLGGELAGNASWRDSADGRRRAEGAPCPPAHARGAAGRRPTRAAGANRAREAIAPPDWRPHPSAVSQPGSVLDPGGVPHSRGGSPELATVRANQTSAPILLNRDPPIGRRRLGCGAR